MKIIKRQYGGPVYSPQGLQNVGNQVLKFIEDGGLKGWITRKKLDEFTDNVRKQLDNGVKHTIKTEEPLKSEDWEIASAIVPAFGGGLGIKQRLKKPKVNKAIDVNSKYVNDIPNEIITHNNTFYEHRFRETEPIIDQAMDDLEKYFLSEDYLNQLRKNFPDLPEQKLEAMAWQQVDNIYKPVIYTSPSPNIIEPNIGGYYKEHPDGTTHIELYSHDKRTPNKTYNVAMHELLHASRGTQNSNISKKLKDKGIWSPGKVYSSTTNINGINKTVDKSWTGLVLKKRYRDYSPEDRAFIDYLLDNDEVRDRALNVRRHMHQYNKTYDEFVSGPKSFDVEQLYQFFTPESIKEYIEKVFTIGVPVGIMTNQNKNEQDTNNMIR